MRPDRTSVASLYVTQSESFGSTKLCMLTSVINYFIYLTVLTQQLQPNFLSNQDLRARVLTLPKRLQ